MEILHDSFQRWSAITGLGLSLIAVNQLRNGDAKTLEKSMDDILDIWGKVVLGGKVATPLNDQEKADIAAGVAQLKETIMKDWRALANIGPQLRIVK